MQTFLPYADFIKSAEVLDDKRLGKQRVEVKQIYNSLCNGGGWNNHPAVIMWEGYENALLLYGISICDEWIYRGFKDSLLDFFDSKIGSVRTLPCWLGDVEFHSSHRSNLLRKDYSYYSQFGWKEPVNLPYVWPS